LSAFLALAAVTPASAEIPEGMLVYGKDSITLVNTGQTDLNLNLLVFVRDGNGSPARFDARDWGVPVLKPGQCVQLRYKNVNIPVPQGCRRLARWLVRRQKVNYFWQSTGSTGQFRVVAGSTNVAACDTKNKQCAFSLAPELRVEHLTLTYTADTMWVSNGALSSTTLNRMDFCRASNGPICIYAHNWRPPDFDQVLEPGECIELSLATPAAEQRPCSVATAFKPKTAFWRQAFYVISPVTTFSTICPPARRAAIRRCIVPR
jgi:hypothetical protein